MSVPVESPAERAVLIAYVYRVGRTLEAWPSLDVLEADTGHYRETISAARRALVARQHLIDTGKRKGVNGRVTVYRINVRQMPPIAPVDNASECAANAADSTDAMSGFSGTDQRQKPPMDQRQKPHGTYEVNLSNEHVHGAQAREPAQSAQAPEKPEVVQFAVPNAAKTASAIAEQTTWQSSPMPDHIRAVIPKGKP